jgi:dTDP-glucose 4,6-dehydratase
MKILVTGGAGFIGGHFIRMFAKDHKIACIDSMTYAANKVDAEHDFYLIDICDNNMVAKVVGDFRPDWIINFAAETHVDRSIDAPATFVETNVVGTFNLLEVVRHYWDEGHRPCKFLQVSTDEVYGSLGPTGKFTETTRYAPNSPYSAAKAAADHFVRAYFKTYGLPVLTTNCSNNYGPFQFPEKLIPLMICNALNGKDLPIYGDGRQVRDWLFVEDHCRAIELVLREGKLGEVYNVGGNCEMENIAIVEMIKDMVGQGNIAYVADRPGHDKRYAVDCSKIENELGWKPVESFETGLEYTVDWFKDNQDWVKRMGYRQERLGTGRILTV